MRLRRIRRQNRGIELTPLIDVVFLLLVFLILTANFQQPALELDLPSGSTDEAQQEQTVVVELAADGTTTVDGVEVTPDDVETRLRAALESVERRAVRLRADQAAPYGRILPLIEAAQRAGAVAVDLEHQGNR